MIDTPQRPPRIALLVDNPQRDLPGLALVAWQLCHRGAHVFLVPMNLRMQELWSLAPDFVLVNHVRTVYNKLLTKLFSCGIQVGLLDTEGGVFSRMPDAAQAEDGVALPDLHDNEPPPMEPYGFTLTDDRDFRHKVAPVCAWNQAFADYALAHDWFDARQVSVTGPPRIDFIAEQWRSATRRMSDVADRYAEPIVLINASFPLVNPRFQSREQEKAALLKRTNYGEDWVERNFANQDMALHTLTDLTNTLAESFPEATFIYRPHPFERLETYDELLHDCPNLHLLQEGTADGWLLRAQALVHYSCSTAIEAFALGVPAFKTSWLPQRLYVPAVENVSIRCTSPEEIVEGIRQVLRGGYQMPDDVQRRGACTLVNTFHELDGHAGERVADAIWRSVSENRPTPDPVPCKRLAMQHAKDSHCSPAAWAIRRLLGLPATWSFRRMAEDPPAIDWDQSGKHYDLNTVRTIVDALRTCAGDAAQPDSFPVRIDTAMHRREYRFGYRCGRAIALYPEHTP